MLYSDNVLMCRNSKNSGHKKMTLQKTLVIFMFHFKVTPKMVCTQALISCCSQHRYLLLWVTLIWSWAFESWI